MAGTQFCKHEEEYRPDHDEEGQDKKPDGPVQSDIRGPEICPISSIWRTQEIVLQYDHDEKPKNNLSPEKSLVERRYFARSLVREVTRSDPMQNISTDIGIVIIAAFGEEVRALSGDEYVSVLPQ
jgi:hypothetical protein